jgi:hypothetical protein
LNPPNAKVLPSHRIDSSSPCVSTNTHWVPVAQGPPQTRFHTPRSQVWVARVTASLGAAAPVALLVEGAACPRAASHLAARAHGGFEFSEGTTAKWLFDVAEFSLHVEKTKIMLGCLPCQLIECLKTAILNIIVEFSDF